MAIVTPIPTIIIFHFHGMFLFFKDSYMNLSKY